MNENFKNYFKFPLKMWEDFSLKIFTNDNGMALDWMIGYSPKTLEVKKNALAKINGEDITFNSKASFRHENGIIYLKKIDDTEIPFLRVRGWGMLTGVGGYNLDADVAADIQDAFAEYCVMMLNK